MFTMTTATIALALVNTATAPAAPADPTSTAAPIRSHAPASPGIARAPGPSVAGISDASASIERGASPVLRERHLGDAYLDLLRIEGRRAGPLVTRDREILSGRIVVDSFEIPSGTEVYIESGTELVITGPSRLDGHLVPIGGIPKSAPTAASSGLVDDCIDTLEAVCPTFVGDPGRPGSSPGTIVILLLADTVITDAFVGICAGAAPEQAGGSVLVQGDRSAMARAGRGGDGVDVAIVGAAGVTLVIDGPVCNATGGQGGYAEAIGAAGVPCDCGGDAVARGGDGGDAGSLIIEADFVEWTANATLTVAHGGAGGAAVAKAGPGGDCFECGVSGGRGGAASARGGDAGRSARVSLSAVVDMTPAPAVVLAGFTSFAPASSGGNAEAFSGRGGDAAPCIACAEDGGEGGPAEDACADGGRGADGIVLAAREAGVPVAVLGSDGGDGGFGWAFGAIGGFGGAGASCPCSYPGIAGSGGDGGEGADAYGNGGAGGRAYGGPAAVALATPRSGDGGGAIANCGFGGNGGVGGSCILDQPENCISGGGGIGGIGGFGFAQGGPAGPAGLGAVAGDPGLPADQAFMDCDFGADGAEGLVICNEVPPCCEPSNQPGCADPLCAELVCGIAPHCCEIAWDLLCAGLANDLCPICFGGDA